MLLGAINMRCKWHNSSAHFTLCMLTHICPHSRHMRITPDKDQHSLFTSGLHKCTDGLAKNKFTPICRANSIQCITLQGKIYLIFQLWPQHTLDMMGCQDNPSFKCPTNPSYRPLLAKKQLKEVIFFSGIIISQPSSACKNWIVSAHSGKR